jgi:hypothetical protein
MSSDEPMATHNLDGYGNPPLKWTRVRAQLGAMVSQAPGTGGPNRHTYWIATLNADGSPHVVGTGIVIVDETWYFVSGARARKSRNLARDPRCALTLSTDAYDLTVEGRAERVVDQPTLETVAAAFRDDGWPAEVEGDSLAAPYSAPSAGPSPWDLYRVVPTSVVALWAEEPGGATRFDLR